MASARIPIVADISGTSEDMTLESFSELGVDEVLPLEVGGTGVQTLDELKQLLGLDISSPLDSIMALMQPIFDDLTAKQAELDVLIEATTNLPTAFLGLTDTPDTYIAGKVLMTSADSIIFSDPVSGLPSFTGNSLRYARVNSAATAIEYVELSIPNPLPDTTGKAYYQLTVKSDESGYELTSPTITNKYRNII